VRRIFPALSLVLLAALSMGWFTLLQDDFAKLGWHVAAGGGFISNLVLWQELGYFDAAAETKPLLHLWSLGVEEQFYLLVPAVLALGFKFRREALKGLIALTLIASFVFYLWIGRSQPESAFYLPQARFWELLVGSLFAFHHTHTNNGQGGRSFGRWMQSPALNRYLPWLGLLMLVIFLWWAKYSKAQFLGFVEALPVLATAAWLSTPKGWWNQKVLSRSWLVGIGKISFPLYLWHWLLLSFCHLFNDAKPFNEIRTPALIASFVLAWATYQWVESPLRFGRLKTLSVSHLLWPMLILILAGLGVGVLHGVPSRDAASVHRVQTGDLGQDEFQAYIAQLLKPCAQQGAFNNVTQGVVKSRCATTSSGDRTADYLLLGDSHAEHLIIGLTQAYPSVAFSYVTREGLPLLSNAGFKDQFEWLASAPIKGVVLSAHWSSKLQDVNAQSFEKELQQTLELLLQSGKHVVLMDDIPIFPINAERCAYTNRLWVTHRCDASINEVTKNPVDFVPLVKALQARYPHLVYVNPSSYLCDSNECHMAQLGQLLYRDRNHLGILGSQYVGQQLQSQFPDLFQ
jgi:peptidoglycan/LPS O-acetylase OafA/YrhL